MLVLVLVVLVVDIGMNVTSMLAGVALKYLAVFFQLLAVVFDDLAGSVVGLVAGDHQLYSECLSEKAQIDSVAVVVVVLQARARIDRQSNLAGIGVVSDVQVAGGTANVQVLVVAVFILILWSAGKSRGSQSCSES